jgi:hypothetical protein
MGNEREQAISRMKNSIGGLQVKNSYNFFFKSDAAIAIAK